MPLTSCPTHEALSAYVMGKLTEQAFEAIAEHVDGCTRCQAALESVNQAVDALLPLLHGARPEDGAPKGAELQGLLLRVKSIVREGSAPAAVFEATTVSPARPAPPSKSALEQLGQYRLLEKIGEGGMGTVYKALHVSLEKIFALKVLAAERLNNPAAVARFQREMKAVGRLDHPNIVRATDAGEAAGVHFLVMEFVPGVDLAKLVRQRHPLRVADACEIGRQAALGLQHAHEHGLIHRDIKPSNLVLGPDGVVKILDMGLARLHAATPPAQDLTASGLIMGTIDYMAPEQMNDPKSVDIRADIYSLGCTLYHLLAGQPPFSKPEYTYPAQKLAAHLQNPVPSIREVRPEAPADLAAVLERMLAKRPQERFTTPAEVANILGPFAAESDLVSFLSANERQIVCEAAPVASATTSPDARLDTAPVTQPCRGDKRPRLSAQVRGRSRLRRRKLTLPAATALSVAAFGAVVLISVAIWSSRERPVEGEKGGNNPGEKPDLRHQTGPIVEKKLSAAGPAEAVHSLHRKHQGPPPAAIGAGSLAKQGFDFLKKYCYRCHGIDLKVPGYNVLDRTVLIARRGKDEPPYVTPGNAEQSLMWQRVGVEKDMPPSGAKPSETDRQLFKKWIESGAPFPGRPSRPFKTERDILVAIRDHLRATDMSDRKFQRYFTLTHLYNNNQSVTADELRLYRAAFAKLANSLSWKQTIVVPRAVDPDETIYNVDLRKLGWSEKDLWKEILKAYPYGLTHNQNADTEMRKLAAEVYAFSDCELPYLKADWFIATASRPPLYHTLLQLPNQARKLEQQLRVDVQKEFRDSQLARAGLMTSGVSRQNRLLDRHDAVYGSYWKSYDFKSNEGTANLVQFPLGPVFQDNPFLRQAFEHAGGEIIFNLPNGLQGYLLVDNKDKRIDEGPIGIVRDSQETAGTPVIVNGLSCMACHKHGMIRFEDKLRVGSAVAGDARLKVQELYRTKEEMNRLLDQDEKRFVQALDAATGVFLKVDDDRAKSIREFPEAVGAIARLYVKDLNLEEVAFELGVSDPKKLQALIEANGKLRELGLGPLLQGGAIKRELWSSQTFALSLFHNVARELGLGTPYVAF
jgi:serine/threonine protein kinase